MHRCLLSLFAGRRPFFSATTFRTSTWTIGIKYRRDYADMEKKTNNSPKAQLPSSDEPFIVRFYRSGARDDEGRTLKDILNFNDDALERHHDYIQVIFPLPERSPYNPDTPRISKEVRETFLEYEHLRDHLYEAFVRMANFYAFDVSGNQLDPTLRRKNDFDKLAGKRWRTRMDHNHLRITRIIRSLRILGLRPAALAFHDALVANEGQKVSNRSLMYWERAAKRPLHLSPDEADENAPGIAWLKEE